MRCVDLADQIDRLNIGTQPEVLAHLTGEPGAQVTGAGADETGIYLRGQELGQVKSPHGGLPSQTGSAGGEAGMQCVGGQDERILQIHDRPKVAFHAVVTGQDLAQQRRGACVEFWKLGRAPNRSPALRLREPRSGTEGGKSGQIRDVMRAVICRLRWRPLSQRASCRTSGRCLARVSRLRGASGR